MTSNWWRREIWLPRFDPAKRAPLRNRAFVERMLLFAAILGAAIRARIYIGAPITPAEPVRWFFLGIAQDIAILAFAGAVILLFARYAERFSRILLALFLFLVAVLHFAWSEAVIFFGHPIRSSDLQTNLHPRLFIGSAQGTVLATFALVIAGYWVAVTIVNWLAGRSRVSVVSGGRLLVVAIIASAAAVLPVKAHLIETSRNPLVAIAELMKESPLQHFRGEIEIPPPSLPPTAIREIMPSHRRGFLDDEFPLAYQPAQRSASALELQSNVRPNIIIFLMEGIRTEEVGAYGGTPANLTPNINRLARDGIVIDDVYSAGHFTPEGELAVWYGLLASPYELVIRTRPDVRVTGLPEILKENGWSTFVWVHPGDATLYLSSRFYLHHGFRMIDGRDFVSSEPRTSWGYSDKALVRRGLEALDKTKEPFAAMLLTVSNHHPFKVPSDAESHYELPAEKRAWVPFVGAEQVYGLHTIPMMKTVHYTDEALGYLMEEARRRPWFKNTIFVVLGDHGLPVPPLSGVVSTHHFARIRHRVPLILYSPLLEGGKIVPGPASHADILPTLLGLLGVTSPRPGVGIDLFDPADRDPERPVISCNGHGRLISVFTSRRAYHAKFVLPLPAGDQAFSEEMLIDPIADPNGLENLMETDHASRDRLRRAARVYLEVYPWLIAEGKTGLP